MFSNVIFIFVSIFFGERCTPRLNVTNLVHNERSYKYRHYDHPIGPRDSSTAFDNHLTAYRTIRRTTSYSVINYTLFMCVHLCNPLLIYLNNIKNSKVRRRFDYSTVQDKNFFVTVTRYKSSSHRAHLMF